MLKKKKTKSDDGAVDTEGDGEGGGGKMKKIIMMVVPAVAVGAGAFFFFLGGDGEAAGPTTTLAPIEGDVIPIEAMTVNLVGDDGRYARIGFAVVLDSTADSGLVGTRVPLIQDALLGIMVDYDADMLQSAEGQERLRRDLSAASVALFPDGEVLRVVLTELIVQ
jgi:flagellar protein FliL